MKWYKHWYFLLFVLVFSYIKSVYQRILVRQEVNVYSFTPDAALGAMVEVGILYLVLLFFLKRWGAARPVVLLQILLVSLLSYLVFVQCFGYLIALIFDNVERNFNQTTFLWSTTSYLLNGIIYGSFFLGYVYYRTSLQQNQEMHAAVQAQAELKIAALRAQLNPHFLFNNLNVLDQLIEEDRGQASRFLQRFSDIYRYVLRVSAQTLVPLEEEMEFVRNYFSMISTKYGSAYILSIEGNPVHGEVIPLSIQLLLENAVQHNVGTEEEPVEIFITLGDKIEVMNNKSPRLMRRESSGTGLKNLQEQYGLLSVFPLEIVETDTYFSVSIPLLL
jgi:sensor histidine kinase YesM